jgi:hypothetical protein
LQEGEKGEEGEATRKKINKIFYRKEKKEKARGGGLEALLDSAERSRCTH